MTGLSWNEIRLNAIQFSREWRDAGRERAEAQTFWNEFFQVYGIRRRTVASFEEPVRSLKDTHHRIDLFWKGRLLAEHKSAGESLEQAASQAFQYVQELAAAGREDEIPQYIIISDFRRIVLHNLEPDDGGEAARIEFPLVELHSHIKDFSFFIGQKPHKFGEADKANLKAAAIMARLHDAVAGGHYDARSLERLLVRLLFCLFADSTGIFEPRQFESFIECQTRPNGTDLGAQLNSLFDVLNTPLLKRPGHLGEELAAFPYINGELFTERLPTAGFTPMMRHQILAASRFDWSRISPAIFGSLFQGIMGAGERRQIGAHYTSERDILKVIRPLFLDDLHGELDKMRQMEPAPRRRSLLRFQDRLASLNFLDPACGCGNFLVIAYRELRRLELDVLRLFYDGFESRAPEAFTSDELARLSRVDVSQFYGIEIGEWPARIAETALWLTDHQMNTELSLATGNDFRRIPLRAAPHIRRANALRFDWNDLLPIGGCHCVLGNPPFVGKKEQSDDQKADHRLIWDGTKGSGILDYVTCWYIKAAQYIQGTRVRCAFVSTNSIAQGEQVGILWSRMQADYGIRIHFAHGTFAWQSEASGPAHVHVVIIGFAPHDIVRKPLYIYDSPKGEPAVCEVPNINPYLIDGPDVLITNRVSPLCDIRPINYGSMMIDKDRNAGADEGLIIGSDERKALLHECPDLRPFIRKIYGGEEFINGTHRWCLWLVEAPAQIMRGCARLRGRIECVRRFRSLSPRKATNVLAATPALFGEIRQPATRYLLIPKVSSEARAYIPMGFLPPSIIASGSALVMPGASLFDFGILTSSMHMIWVRTVGGRLESRLQYSSNIIYNNFPWPVDAAGQLRSQVVEKARVVIDVRRPLLAAGASLADLYDPNAMPATLVKAHRALDRAVERCYRASPFQSDRERLRFLFQLYERLTSPLAPGLSAERPRRSRRTS